MTAQIKHVFGRYLLHERFAVGGMAEIWRATAKGLGGFEKTVAIKRLHPQFSDDDQFVRMLEDEARVAVLLQHSNIVQIYDLGRVAGQHYIAMELVEGRDLFQVLRALHQQGERMPLEAAASVALELCHGLHYAHTRLHPESRRPLGVVHRDVSPQNVLLSWAGEVKLTDFGIVKAAMRSTITQAGTIKGKLFYMSPEQALGHDVDARSDVFSTGIVLFECLTSTPLYEDADNATLLGRVQAGEVRSPRTVRADVPSDLDAIVMRALAKRPSDRYASCQELGRALAAALSRLGRVYTKTDLADLLHRLFHAEAPDFDVPVGLSVTLSGESPALPPSVDPDPTPAAIRSPVRAPAVTREARPSLAPRTRSSLDTDPTRRLKRAELASLQTGASEERTSPEIPARLDDEPPAPRPAPTPVEIHSTPPAAVMTTRPEPRPTTASIAPAVVIAARKREASRRGSARAAEALARGRRRERRLRWAITGIWVAIVLVGGAIIYLAVTPPRPVVTASSDPASSRTSEVAPRTGEAAENTPPTPTVSVLRPDEDPSPDDDRPATLRVGRRAGGRFKLYLDGDLTAPKDGALEIEPGRHTLRARLLPEGTFTREQVIVVDRGTTIDVRLD